MKSQVVDGMTKEQVKYNIFSMARSMRRFEQKIERARSEASRERWKRRYFDEKFYWELNVKMLGRFESTEAMNA